MAWTLGIVFAFAALLLLPALRRKPKRIEAGSSIMLEGKGKFAVEVVGESHYQSALRACVVEDGYVVHDCEAYLVYEDNNRYDKNAVQILIGGQLVGYLPRMTALAYRRILSEQGVDGVVGIAKAKIYGGGRKSYGVWLYI